MGVDALEYPGLKFYAPVAGHLRRTRHDGVTGRGPTGIPGGKKRCSSSDRLAERNGRARSAPRPDTKRRRKRKRSATSRESALAVRVPRGPGEGDVMEAAATDVTFKVGDKAVYPAQGVAEVIRIEEKDIAGKRQRFYVLRILDTDRKIMVPVSNASAVGLRQVISEEEILEIFDILKERTIAFDNQTWNRRYRGFMDKIKTGSIYDVAEVLRDLYRLKTDKQLSFGERRMLDTARTLIVKEIAIARSQTEEQVKTEIESIFVSN
jgi:CarD family transcriptional regulator